jgi:hypothetical protein
VGDVFSGSVLVPLAERWNGTTWTVQSPPAPSRATDSYLLADSCTSSKVCTAVGEYRTGSGDQFSFAEGWNGTSWKLEKTPDPSGTTTDALNWVSCVSADDCEAVGGVSPGSPGLLIERWNGTSWKIESASLPSGGRDGYLLGVSCTSSSACTAVGDYFNGSHTVPLGELWNGTSWTTEAVAAPGGAVASSLSGVSCTSAKSCIAVGSEDLNSTGLQPMGERWSGTTWTIRPASVPSGSPSALVSVSCTSSSFCDGVGYFTPSGGNNTDLAEQWS